VVVIADPKAMARLLDGRFQYKGSYMTGLWVDMKLTAVVRSGEVTVLPTTYKTMPFDLEQLRYVGIEPAEQRIIVVKSAIAWRAAYGPIAKAVQGREEKKVLT